MKCIYCRGPTTLSESEEHPLPSSLGSTEWLPAGACCSECNNYLSALDTALVMHPHLRCMIVFGQLRDRKGRTRVDLAPHFEAKVEGGGLHIDVSQATGKLDEDGKLVIQGKADRRWDDWKFSRALHKVGLGLFAHAAGAEAALNPRLDEVRDYIRKPTSRSQVRSYAQRTVRRETSPWELRNQIVNDNRYEYHFLACEEQDWLLCYLHLWIDEFFIALGGSLNRFSDSDLDHVAEHLDVVPRGAPGDWIRKLS